MEISRMVDIVSDILWWTPDSDLEGVAHAVACRHAKLEGDELVAVVDQVIAEWLDRTGMQRSYLSFDGSE